MTARPAIKAPLGRIPLGLQPADNDTRDPDGRRLHWQAHPDEAEIVIDLFEGTADGDSLAVLLRELAEDGLHRRDGKPLTHPSALAILNNPIYAGHRRVDGEYVQAHGIEPLIDLPLFEEVRAILADPRRQRHSAGAHVRYLLSGIALCGICGSAMRVVHFPSHGSSRAHYRCHQRGGHYLSRAMDAVDEHVIAAVLEIADRQREEWDRLPLTQRREFIRAAVDIEILPVGKGPHHTEAGITLAQRADTTTLRKSWPGRAVPESNQD